MQKKPELTYLSLHTTQKMKFSIMDFFRKCDQIHRNLQIWSHLLKKFLMENFFFCAKMRSNLQETAEISTTRWCFFKFSLKLRVDFLTYYWGLQFLKRDFDLNLILKASIKNYQVFGCKVSKEHIS